MSTPTTEGIVAIYRREAAREGQEVAAGSLAESSHASVLGATRTHVHLLLRQPPNEILNMQQAWLQTDLLVRAAGIWDAPPSGEAVPAQGLVAQ